MTHKTFLVRYHPIVSVDCHSVAHNQKPLQMLVLRCCSECRTFPGFFLCKRKKPLCLYRVLGSLHFQELLHVVCIVLRVQLFLFHSVLQKCRGNNQPLTLRVRIGDWDVDHEIKYSQSLVAQSNQRSGVKLMHHEFCTTLSHLAFGTIAFWSFRLSIH